MTDGVPELRVDNATVTHGVEDAEDEDETPIFFHSNIIYVR